MAQAVLAPATSFLVCVHHNHGSCNEEGRHEGRHEGKEGDEARDEGHESDEGNGEGEEGEQNCEGAGSEGCSAQRQEGKDSRWPDRGLADQEQGRQSRVQESVGLWQKEQVVRGRQASTRGVEDQGLLRVWWLERTGQGVACQDEVHLQEMSLRADVWRALAARVLCRGEAAVILSHSVSSTFRA